MGELPETPYKFQQKPTKTNIFQHFAIKAPTVSIVVKTSVRFLTSSKGKVTATISSRPPAAVIYMLISALRRWTTFTHYNSHLHLPMYSQLKSPLYTTCNIL